MLFTFSMYAPVLDAVVKRPCSGRGSVPCWEIPDNQKECHSCSEFRNDENGCLKNGCVWEHLLRNSSKCNMQRGKAPIRVLRAYSFKCASEDNSPVTICRSFACEDFYNKAACNKHHSSDGCWWSDKIGYCLEKGRKDN